MAKKKTKAEELQEAVAEAVGAGRELHLESVDFSDPNRPKTCLEVDFPILPINHVAAIEGNAGKPIYQMSKWWARRRSSVFRAMLIAAATKAPEDQGEAAKTVWDAYYGNHQKNEAFRKLKVADIFMGGGTTIVEGARLGMQMYGNDLNPVAWLVVKNELAQVDPQEVQKLLDAIEAVVKPQIMPFYACDCPRGHKGKWTHKPTGKLMEDGFDPLSLTPEQRPEYRYQGPELLHTFWAKHGPCLATECNHRTPIMSSPVVGVKTLTVKAWTGNECKTCGKKFDIERQDARMAPTAMLIVADTETPFAVMDENGNYTCPHCGHVRQDQKAANDGESASLGKANNKKIDLTLLVHPNWLKGSPGVDTDGSEYGGGVTDSPESTARWNDRRAESLSLIEIRGDLPKTVTWQGETFHTDEGTVPKQSTFTCMASTCGGQSNVLEAVQKYGKAAPVAAFAAQGYCPQCKDEGKSYSGRFFDVPKTKQLNAALFEWSLRSTSDLAAYWPKSQLFRYEEGNDSKLYIQPSHGFTHWYMMFNPRQRLIHAQLLRSLLTADSTINWITREFVLGAFQLYLRNQNMFCFWHRSHDHFAPALSNNNFHPKDVAVEVGAFSPVGYGPWSSTVQVLEQGLNWTANPWEIVSNDALQATHSISGLTGRGTKVGIGDSLGADAGSVTLSCRSSTALDHLTHGSIDLVITDPPFGDNIHYSDLSDFFYAWLVVALKERGGEYEVFAGDHTPKVIEAISNRGLHSSDADSMYKRLLTQCWAEAYRVLSPGGLLAFTFHHSEDEPWVAVLESLFNAGFYLEATYPIRSDETKGEGQFGSKTVEFDIIHVCRKRLENPEHISWARLRRQIMKDVRQLQEIIEQHQKEGLGEADLQVIRRGKALEYYSRHYGKVYIERGREEEFTVRDALVGINQLLDDESDTTSETPPVLAEPYTRQFLRLFADKGSLERDQMQKHLRGTGVSPSEFLERGWCSEEKKVFTVADPLEWANQWKGKSRKGMSRDFDQTYFLIGACYDDSGIKLSDTLNSGSFVPHPAISDLLDWFGKHGSDSNMKAASKRAKQIYSSWLAKNTTQVVTQRTLFDLEDDE